MEWFLKFKGEIGFRKPKDFHSLHHVLILDKQSVKTKKH